jgi:hypothetical protein
MKKIFKKHIIYYSVQLSLLAAGFILTVLASPNLNIQKITISLTIAAYVAWGIFHHLKNHELTIRIMIEYILIGLFGLSIVFFLIGGGV